MVMGQPKPQSLVNSQMVKLYSSRTWRAMMIEINIIEAGSNYGLARCKQV